MNYRELIKQHEGFRNKVYLDTEGNATCGWGHLLPPSFKIAPLSEVSFSKLDCENFFDKDMQQVERDYVWLEKELALRKIGVVRRAVLKNMLFNLGLRKLLGFRNMLRALLMEDFAKARREMLDSKWATQVKGRAKTLAKMMETNEWQTE